MAITLIVNPGSSSKKYTLYRDERPLVSYKFERNEQSYELCLEKQNGAMLCERITASLFTEALTQVLSRVEADNLLLPGEVIARVGVRVVAPGTFFQSHRIVDDAYCAALTARIATAPLHIPHTVAELRALTKHLPGAVIVGVSDSAFHSTLPSSVRTYPIATADTLEYDLYRFGYHGLSVASIARQLPRILPGQSRVVVCHIGSGMSMTALKDGVSIETTMGFGPGSGLMMGARVGDIEPAVVLELQRVKHFSPTDMQAYLQTQGGFVGLTGEADFRQLLHRSAAGDASVAEAFAVCRHRFQKALAGMQMALGGLDAVVLTATAVERSSQLRTILLADLTWFGITLDEDRNEATIAKDGIISTGDSPVWVAVMRTNEAGELLRETIKVATQ